MERSFKKEVQALTLGDGETFHGEGILAVTKALLQAGVSYVGGYQGAPVSHLLDVLVDAQDIMAELGVHLETCSNEASAAAMLGASINYPLRGAVTWKSIVGTNVAADALSNLASPGLIGGAMIILGEDYGEGASVIQERSYAYALKSSMWLLDPRPDLPSIVRTVEKGFELSKAGHRARQNTFGQARRFSVENRRPHRRADGTVGDHVGSHAVADQERCNWRSDRHRAVARNWHQPGTLGGRQLRRQRRVQVS